MGRCAVLPQWRDRRIWRCRGGAQSPGCRTRMAREQALSLWRAAGTGGDYSRRVVYRTGGGQPWRYLSFRLWPARLDRFPHYRFQEAMMTIDVSNEGELPFGLDTLRETVGHFVRREVAPVEAKLSLEQAKLDPDQQAARQARARELGLWALATPKRLGGAGLDVLAQTIVAEEAAKCRLGAFFPAAGAIGGDPPSVLFHG